MSSEAMVPAMVRTQTVHVAHQVLSDLQSHVQRKFGRSLVGPVLVAAVRTTGEDEAPDRDSLQIWFKLGTQQITLTLPMSELETRGLLSVDLSYDRLVGRPS